MPEPGAAAAAMAGQLMMAIDPATGLAQHVPLGTLADTAWDGNDDPVSLIALWKAIYAKLDEVATNTAG